MFRTVPACSLSSVTNTAAAVVRGPLVSTVYEMVSRIWRMYTIVSFTSTCVAAASAFVVVSQILDLASVSGTVASRASGLPPSRG